MDIEFKATKLEKLCSSLAAATKKWGDKKSHKLIQRLTELRNVDNMSEISYLPPQRLHSVDNIRRGCWAVRVEGGLRVVFKPNNVPLPKLPDGGVDKSKVTSVKIMAVEDYHGK